MKPVWLLDIDGVINSPTSTPPHRRVAGLDLRAST